MSEKKYHTYIEPSQAGGDSFGLSLWKDDVSATFWGTLQDIYDLGVSIIKEAEETQKLYEELGRILVVSKQSEGET